MAVTWDVSQIDRSNTNAVHTVHWRASKTETVDSVDHSGSGYGTCSFTPDPTAEGYISWDALTKVNVQAWVQEKLGADAVAAIEASIASQIAESKAPTVLFGYPENWE